MILAVVYPSETTIILSQIGKPAAVISLDQDEQEAQKFRELALCQLTGGKVLSQAYSGGKQIIHAKNIEPD